MKNLRFHTAVSSSRPRGTRMIEAYSPKLGRRLQCFGEEAFRQWICLEADPAIKGFCERPVVLELMDGTKRVADFWVVQEDSEMLLLVTGECKTSTLTMNGTDLPIRTVSQAERVAARIWIDNWTRILPCITCCSQLIPKSLTNSVLRCVAEPMPLARIEKELATGDPTLIRAAVFSLLHGGQLQAPQLQTEPLSYLTCFQPVGNVP